MRGSVVPVVDLSLKFGLAQTEIGQRTCVVIVEVEIEGEESLMGVMADGVNRVVDWSPESIQPAPAFGTDVSVNCLLGMGNLDDRLIPILDIGRVLSTNELTAVASAPAAATEPAQPIASSAPEEAKNPEPS